MYFRMCLRGICVFGAYSSLTLRIFGVFASSECICIFGVYTFSGGHTHLRCICVFRVYVYSRCVLGSFVSLGHVNPGIHVFGEYTSSRCKGLLGICKIVCVFLAFVYSGYMHIRGIYVFEVYASSLCIFLPGIYVFAVYLFLGYMCLRGICVIGLNVSSCHKHIRGICLFEVYVSSGHKVFFFFFFFFFFCFFFYIRVYEAKHFCILQHMRIRDTFLRSYAYSVYIWYIFECSDYDVSKCILTCNRKINKIKSK